MAIESNNSKAVFDGNGTTTVFPFDFKVWKQSELKVTISDPEGKTSIASGWNASLTDTGGSVTYQKDGAPLPKGWKLAIVRNMPFTQLVDLLSGTRFDPQVIEDSLDIATAERQQLLEALGRAVIVAPTDDRTPEQVAEEILLAQKYVDESLAKIQIAMGNLFSQVIEPFTTQDNVLDYTVGEDIVLDPDANNILLSLGGVVQEPDAAYTITGKNTIHFNSNPGDGIRCWGISCLSFSNPDIRAIVEKAIAKIHTEGDVQASRAEKFADAAEASASSAASDAADVAADKAHVDTVAGEVKNLKANATTLDAGRPATASYDPVTGTLELGIPKGDSGSSAVMTGATETLPGAQGAAPAPQAGQQNFFLRGDGTWAVASGLPLGHFFAWPFSTPPDGSIIVNGSTYSRTLYADLWAYISSKSDWVKTESEWQSIASANGGYCPYYSDGDGSTTFRVPKFAPYQQIALSSASAGTYHEAGLPDIDGKIRSYVYDDGKPTGAFTSIIETYNVISGGSTSRYNYTIYGFNASRSSSIYGNSATVTPESHDWIVCVVAFGTATNVGSVDVAEVMAAVGVVQANPNLQGVAHIVETWKSDDGSGWYRIYSDGWCEQGGIVASGQISATFYKPFIDNNFYINLFALSKNNTDIKHAQIIQNQISNESFNAYVVSYGSPSSATQDSNYYFKWEAKGFIKE